ncbi:MAG TPA: mycothiol conjugate amidase Mca, partial [Streptosporangiaceae bacterium]|nr:mycothiol conjugate amidase Mca [Streptosporangiaceae bacterium]
YADRIAEWDKEEQEEKANARPMHAVTTSVPCGDYFEIRNQALIAHATQVDPDGGWFSVSAEVQRSAWPTEDYHLARSLVDSVTPEDDLFAGIRERVRL